MITNNTTTFSAYTFPDPGSFRSTMPLIESIRPSDDINIFGIPDLAKLDQNQLHLIDRSTLENKPEEFIRTIQVDRIIRGLNIKNETILDDGKIIQKVPRVITIKEALKEQTEFVKKQVEKERKYWESTEEDFSEGV